MSEEASSSRVTLFIYSMLWRKQTRRALGIGSFHATMPSPHLWLKQGWDPIVSIQCSSGSVSVEVSMSFLPCVWV